MKRLIAWILSAALAASLCVTGTWAHPVPGGLDEICTDEEWQMLCLVNKQRLAQDLDPYSIFPALQSAAHVRTQELVTLYSHTRPNEQAWHTAITEAGVGYRTAAENIAAGQVTATDAVTSWLNSEGHRNNILDATYLHAGMGYADDGFLGTSWVNLFMTDNCAISAMELSQTSVTYTGGAIEDFGIYITATCTKHGDCYLPLLDDMCSGYDPASDVTQTVTVAYAGRSATLQIQGSSAALDTSGADSWAVNWLNRADELGLLSPRNRTNFTSNVTRLQFADLAVRLAQQLTGTEIAPAAGDAFTDTDEAVILKAKAAGIASGYAVDGGFEFRPENPITRQEICVMLANVLAYVEQTVGKADLDRSETLSNAFPDTADVADWAAKAVALMCNNGVMSGRAQNNDTLLTPLAYTSLQESITLAVKLFDLLN